MYLPGRCIYLGYIFTWEIYLPGRYIYLGDVFTQELLALITTHLIGEKCFIFIKLLVKSHLVRLAVVTAACSTEVTKTSLKLFLSLGHTTRHSS